MWLFFVGIRAHFYESKEDTAANSSNNQAQEIIDEAPKQNTNIIKDKIEAVGDDDEEDDDDEPVDMDSYDHNVIDDEDDQTTVVTKKDTKLESKIEDDSEDRFIPTRTYDLNITYDNYYRTPRSHGSTKFHRKRGNIGSGRVILELIDRIKFFFTNQNFWSQGSQATQRHENGG